jgi:phospholipid transport system transporter-binding protein
MIRRDADRVVVSGPLTLATVAADLGAGMAAIAEGARSVDLAEVGELDSSALALLLAWAREAQRLGRDLVFTNLPRGLTTIAQLYGVAELLTAAPASVHH